MKKIVIALCLMAMMFLGVVDTHAQRPESGPAHGKMPYPEAFGPKKDNPLTPEQETKFEELERKFKEENAQLIGTLVTKKMQFQSLWNDPKADPKAILGKEKELRDLENQMRDKTFQMRLEARKLLTPKQIIQWKPDWERGHGLGYGPIGRGPKGRGGMMEPF